MSGSGHSVRTVVLRRFACRPDLIAAGVAQQARAGLCWRRTANSEETAKSSTGLSGTAAFRRAPARLRLLAGRIEFSRTALRLLRQPVRTSWTHRSARSELM